MSENNGWIKCSERLPKPNTRVLICSQDKEVGVALYEELTGFGYIPLYGEVTTGNHCHNHLSTKDKI